MQANILEMKGISKRFYGVPVLKNVKLEVRAGEVHILLGENGAGKSTLMKILSGAYSRETGEIWLEEQPLTAKTPKETLTSGISIIYQEFNLVPNLSIYENIFLGKEYRKRGFIDKNKAIREAKKYMDMLGLYINPTALVGSLSIAQKQLVEIAKALSNETKVLVLDEPTAAITDNEKEMLFAIIRDLKARGLGIIYISHRMNELFEIGDRCTIMRDGEYIATVNMAETTEAELTRQMVGRNVCLDRVANHCVDQNCTILETKGLYYKNILTDINLDLKKGEILGIAGLIGAGRTELAKCIIGAYKPSGGRIFFQGKPLKGGIKNAIEKGIVYLSEDRKDEGLILSQTILDNITLPSLRSYGRILLSRSRMAAISSQAIADLKIRTPSHISLVQNLSGGNQQKVVIAKWLERNADVYIFDEPTRGIDVGARDEIYTIMSHLVQNGAAILLISSDMVEIMRMSDRVAVMKEGEIAAVLDNNEALTQEMILQYALHGGKHDEYSQNGIS